MKYFSSLLVLAIAVSSCTFPMKDPITGDGNVKQERYQVDTITFIQVSNGLLVDFYPRDTLSVILEADENLHEHIIIEESEGVLTIRSDKNIRLAKAKRIIVSAPGLAGIDLSSGANFNVHDSLVSPEKFTLHASSGSEVNIRGSFSLIEVYGSSAAEIELEGSCEQLYGKLSSAAELDAYEFESRRSVVNASSAADARVNVSEEADFEASSAADIRYRGTPQHVNNRSSSAGNIKQVRD